MASCLLCRRFASLVAALLLIIIGYQASAEELTAENFALDRVIIHWAANATFVNPEADGIASKIEVKKLPDGADLKVFLNRLNARSDVVIAEPDYKVKAIKVSNDYQASQLWGLEKIKAPAAWDYSTGSEAVTVCIIDTGIQNTHPDLQANMHPIKGADCTDPRMSVPCTTTNGGMDDNGHGSHCAGTIGAVGNNGIGVVGVNWNVKLLACKFLDASGSGYDSGSIKCLDWCLSQGAKISSNSYGGGGASETFKTLINSAAQQNHLFIAAAGNESQNNDNAPSPSYPASYNLPNVISVAATGPSDTLASFSNFGPATTHIAAPGVSIQSTWIRSGYNTISGTSMACPHVAGAVALAYAASGLTKQPYPDIRNLLLAKADKISGLTTTVKDGNRLNVAALVASVVGPQPPNPPPSPPPPPPPPMVHELRPTSLGELGMGSLPAVSRSVRFGEGATNIAITIPLASLCGATDSMYYSRLVSTIYKKHVMLLNDAPASAPSALSINTCSVNANNLDTVMSVFVCDAASSTTNPYAVDPSTCVCSNNDDGCTLNTQMGSRVRVDYAAGKRVFAIVYSYYSDSNLLYNGSSLFAAEVKDETPSETPTPPPMVQPPPPPPAPNAFSPTTPNVAMATLPVNSDQLQLGAVTASSTPLAPGLANLCPGDTGYVTYADRLMSTNYNKHIVFFEPTNNNSDAPVPSEIKVETCTQNSRNVDTVIAVFVCDAAGADSTNPYQVDPATCTCATNDDGCGASFWGSSVKMNYEGSGKRVFVVVSHYYRNTNQLYDGISSFAVTMSDTTPVSPPPVSSPPPSPPSPPPPSPPSPPPPSSPSPPPPSPPSPPPPNPPPPPPLPNILNPTAPVVPLIQFPIKSEPLTSSSSTAVRTIPTELAAKCQGSLNNLPYSSRLTSTSYNKHIIFFEPNTDETKGAVPSIIGIDTCTSNQYNIDTVMSVFSCDPALDGTDPYEISPDAVCSCVSVDDGCGGYAVGSKIKIPYTKGQRIFAIVTQFYVNSSWRYKANVPFAVGATNESPPPPSPPPPPPNPSPPPPPPNPSPPPAPVVFAPTTTTQTMSRLPIYSPYMRFGYRAVTTIDPLLAAKCAGSLDRVTVATRLTSSAYKKHVVAFQPDPTGALVPEALAVETCSYNNANVDTVMSLFVCDAALARGNPNEVDPATCVCTTNDNGCGRYRYGSKVATTYAAGKRVFAVLTHYRRNSNLFFNGRSNFSVNAVVVSTANARSRYEDSSPASGTKEVAPPPPPPPKPSPKKQPPASKKKSKKTKKKKRK